MTKSVVINGFGRGFAFAWESSVSAAGDVANMNPERRASPKEGPADHLCVCVCVAVASGRRSSRPLEPRW